MKNKIGFFDKLLCWLKIHNYIVIFEDLEIRNRRIYICVRCHNYFDSLGFVSQISRERAIILISRMIKNRLDHNEQLKEAKRIFKKNKIRINNI